MLEILAGKIDRYRHDGNLRLAQRLEVLANLLVHVQVQLVDLAGLLKGGNEEAWRDEPVGRVNPTCKRFHPAQGFRHGTHDWLVGDMDPPLRHRLRKMLDHILSQRSFFLDFLVEKHICRLDSTLKRVAGKPCVVAGSHKRDRFRAIPIDAHLQRRAVSVMKPPDFGEHPLQSLFDMVPLCTDYEMVALEP